LMNGTNVALHARVVSTSIGRISVASFAALAGATLATWMLAVGLTQIVGGACLPLHEGALVFRTEVATSQPPPAPTGRIRATTIVTHDPTNNPFDSTMHAASAPKSTALADAPCPGGF